MSYMREQHDPNVHSENPNVSTASFKGSTMKCNTKSVTTSEKTRVCPVNRRKRSTTRRTTTEPKKHHQPQRAHTCPSTPFFAVNNDFETNYNQNAKQSNNGQQNTLGPPSNTTTRMNPKSNLSLFTDRQYNPNQQANYAGIPLQHITHP